MKLNLKFLKHKIISILLLISSVILGQSPFDGLVLEQLNNGNAFEGTTYRLYATLSEGKLYVIYGDETRSSLIETTGEFFNTGTAIYKIK